MILFLRLLLIISSNPIYEYFKRSDINQENYFNVPIKKVNLNINKDFS